jgi:hypothetical protein
MATATFTFLSEVPENPVHLRGDLHQVYGALVFDGGDYVSGGIAVPDATVLLDEILHIEVGHARASAGVTAAYIPTTGKLFVWDEDNTSGIEAEYAAAAISATFPVVVTGRKSA